MQWSRWTYINFFRVHFLHPSNNNSAGVSLPDGDDGDRPVHVRLVRTLLLLRVLLHGHDAHRPLPLARTRRRQHVCHGSGKFYTTARRTIVKWNFNALQSLENLSESQKRLPVREKIAYAMKHAGVSITVTSATDLAAFLIGSTSVIKLHPVYFIRNAL